MKGTGPPGGLGGCSGRGETSLYKFVGAVECVGLTELANGSHRANLSILE